MKPYNGLILISIDGFQSEYLHKFEGLELPNLRSLIASGSYTRFMEPGITLLYLLISTSISITYLSKSFFNN